MTDDDKGFFETLLGDGRALIKLAALGLIGSGAFAFFQAATGHFLPQDTEYLGMTSQQLCALHGCRIVHFMIHDRISFAGVLIAIATMYFWLAEFPLKRGEAWAWWALAISSGAGFLSFLAYLGYGYLDSWHGAATLVLLPIFIGALAKTRALCRVRVRRPRLGLRSRAGIARALLIASTFGIAMAGLTIMTVGMTRVFVPQDLDFMGVSADAIRAINARLIPLIAHDRAGFGGALLSCGLVMFLCVVYGTLSKNLLQALAVTGVVGFGCAIGVHPAIGYTEVTHLGPAILGCIVFFAGLGASVSARSATPAGAEAVA
ncbi:MAG TPA: hypothetical protein VN181_08940 [Thermoanaerobaculia bacterium]|nr:hypothetical protein [Thermoanaerobaculia bacterium]